MVASGKEWESGRLNKNNGCNKILVLHNDNINSFEYVIDCLCEICDHDGIQAEQCAILTHFTGKCQIKIGELDELAPLQNQLTDKNLVVSID
ncbi:ATP-dependent Clp protease adaptor protein ClpS [Saccharicrinis carchari]|uniref:ATP-dependent Clp protease adaptor protein ClpS n=1 Tax=Saccharicrinis carchari TaxID=1168039 RepID=A0A521D6P6_SACCC|nr:ATP-dependent Clp protease adaptor ClpS [Saccharicrinis carchari]SMO66741.1 ATP-dependent Clp protease adaptor protein ClpS [Saccharicrinis carchari]